MPHDVFIRHSKVMAADRGWPQHIYIGSPAGQPILIALQFNKWMTYIYVTAWQEWQDSQ